MPIPESVPFCILDMHFVVVDGRCKVASFSFWIFPSDFVREKSMELKMKEEISGDMERSEGLFWNRFGIDFLSKD